MWIRKLFFTALLLLGGNFAHAQTAGTSYCDPLYPAGTSPDTARTSVSVRIVDPGGPQTNVKAVFDIPAAIEPVDLAPSQQWDPGGRKLSALLGNFQRNETKEIPLAFEGKPVACVIYGILSGQWSPPPAVGPSTWQNGINFSLTFPAPAPVATTAPDAVTALRNTPVLASVATDADIVAGGLGIAAAAVGLPWWNWLHAFTLLSIGSLKRKTRKPWGIVFDKATRQPIGGATVRVYAAATDKLKDSAVTDIDGRFGFLVPAGAYYVRVDHPGFLPYRSSPMEVAEDSGERLNIKVPLEGKEFTAPTFGMFLARVRDALDYISPTVLVLGTILSVLVAALYPKLLHYIIFAIYLGLDALKIIMDRQVSRPFGAVLDKKTGQGLGLAVVRVYESQHGMLLTTRVTTPEGKFKFLVLPGGYRVTSARTGYKGYVSPQLSFHRADLVRVDVPMEYE